MKIQPHGPYSLTTKGQVSIPKRLRDAIGIQLGAKVYFAEDPRVSGVLVVVPTERLGSWIADARKARSRERKGLPKRTTLTD